MANKKINQLALKTTILPTDLFPLGNPTTGQLFKKTVAELQAAIGGAVISVNGLVGTVVLDTDDMQELPTPTNRFFTDARARAAISLTTIGNNGASTYNNSTGVFNVPIYTLAGLGGIGASFLSGGAGISYNSGTGVIAYTGTIYTDLSIRSLLSLTTTGVSGASTYNNSTGVLNVPSYTLAGLGGISLNSISKIDPITYNSSTGAIGITQANGSTNGFLSSNDWSAFNGKQAALTLGNLTEVTSSVLTITGGVGAVVGSGASIKVKQASAADSGFLSSNDWSAFNGKQAAITLTTTGTSGAATLSGGSLNIPIYQSVLTNPVTGTGVTNFVTKWTSSSEIGNSQIFDNGTNVIVAGSGTGNLIVGATSMAFGQSQGYIAGFKSPVSEQSFISIARGTQTLGSQGMLVGLTINNAYVYLRDNIPLVFATNDTDRVTITSSGNLLVGTSVNNGERLYISGDIRATGSITSNSDVRLKKNITRIKNGLDKVCQIAGYTYDTIYDENRHAGVIAQEVDKVLPEIVTKGKDGLMGVQYGNLTALLIEAIKDLKSENNKLSFRLLALEK